MKFCFIMGGNNMKPWKCNSCGRAEKISTDITISYSNRLKDLTDRLKEDLEYIQEHIESFKNYAKKIKENEL